MSRDKSVSHISCPVCEQTFLLLGSIPNTALMLAGRGLHVNAGDLHHLMSV